MPKFSQILANSTLKGLFTTTRWSLLLGCKAAAGQAWTAYPSPLKSNVPLTVFNLQNLIQRNRQGEKS